MMVLSNLAKVSQGLMEFSPLFCLPADNPGASTVESVAGAWRRLALHRADDALSKFSTLANILPGFFK